MRRKAWLLLAIVVVVAVAVAVVAYTLRRPPAPAPVSGGKPPKPVVDEVAEARALVARVKAQSELAASAPPIGPVDEQKAKAALQKLRAQMELERNSAGAPIPKVAAITGAAPGQFQALIGDALVSEGNVVQGYRVQKIHAESVEFEKEGKTWTQKVN